MNEAWHDRPLQGLVAISFGFGLAVALPGIAMQADHPPVLAFKNVELPDWQEFKQLKTKEFFSKIKKWQRGRDEKPALDLPLAIRESIPDWLDELGQAELPDHWDETLHWLNRRHNPVGSQKHYLPIALARVYSWV